MRTIHRNSARVIAYSWHGGQFSPLYAFASTGRVQSEEHRRNVLDEIRRDAAGASKTETNKLHKLLEYIRLSPIETEHRPELSATIPDSTWRRYQ
jgi:hypothetical protein